MADRRLTFLLRLGSSITLWVVISLVLAWKVPAFYLALICGLALVAQWEFFRMLQSAGVQTFSVTATLLSAVFLAGGFLYHQAYTIHTGFDLVAILLLVVALLIRQVFAPIGQLASCQATVFTLFGILYIPWTFHFLSKIIFLTPPSANSVIKRSIQAKDSGYLLPGIGGALDLIDSLLFTGPFLFFYLHWTMHSL
ncbi:MAG: phosphatidate cytidylyltransferase [Candidatus Xiphinematobacter sp.]|nr:MAG: phosphatidate cytidylyltransferase [Candidatus Xiphinematobacter sp.]